MPVLTRPGPNAPPALTVRLEIPDGRQPQTCDVAPGTAVRLRTGESLVADEVRG